MIKPWTDWIKRPRDLKEVVSGVHITLQEAYFSS